MDEAILLPSPNWFLVSGMAVSSDGWVIYGGPSKTLCILEPVASDGNVVVREKCFRSHTFGKVHADKITAIDICPLWCKKKSFITGAIDGTVKLWTLEKVDNTVNIKYLYNHSLHSCEREDVVGVGYSTNNFAVTVGSFGTLVKWDLKSNIVKTYNLILSKFKPTCLSCSPHMCLQVAVGTKQGVVLVVDLSDRGITLYKVRSHDDELLSISWCPQYSVGMSKLPKEFENKNIANKRMERIRQEAVNEQNEQLDDSALTKTLPEDSFDDTIVEEEDFFDMYKDPEQEEFGHKKYTPEVIAVKEQEPKSTEFDYLAECEKLKERILKNKEEPEPSINNLVDALDKTHVDDKDNKSYVGNTKPKKKVNDNANTNDKNDNKPVQKHLLATIGKQGNVCVWSKKGKLLGSNYIYSKQAGLNKNVRVSYPTWAALLWYKPDVLLIVDSKGQLMQCNPLSSDSRNKLDISLIDVIHKRGTFCIVTNAPRIQSGYKASDGNKGDSDIQTKKEKKSQEKNHIEGIPEDQWCIWTAAQDRNIVCYSMTQRKMLSTYNTCGGFIYNIQTCPYDAKKIAMCVGDGAIRIWETDISEDSENKITFGKCTSFWQNVQGKVLVAAWHPTRENILAFGTAESRVGILDISGHTAEKPARVLNLGVSGSVYSVCWGERNDLYVCGGGDIVVWHLRKETDAKTIFVEFEGDKWRMAAVTWCPTGLLCGSTTGSVALLCNTTYEILAVSFVFSKLINSIEWHPQFVSSSSEQSSFNNLIAVTSMDKRHQIAILKYSKDEDEKHHLETYRYLQGHVGTVLQVAWSPHDDARLASTSSDHTVRVWNVDSGICTVIFTGHASSAISLAWSAFPQLSNVLITGGADYCVRLWKLEDHPAEIYKNTIPMTLSQKKERKRRAYPGTTAKRDLISDMFPEEAPDTDSVYGEGREADRMSAKPKAFKKFLLPIASKQMGRCNALVARKLAEKVIAKGGDRGDVEECKTIYDTGFLRMFGTTNEFNELLDNEMEFHLEANDTDAWIMLSIFRGQIDSMIQFASENDLLCPFLVSLAPCVSFKYWKDVTQLYLGQIDRFIAQKREYRLIHPKSYGGPVFRKAALHLSIHDVKSAVDSLVEARLFRDAYVLCRARHLESIAREIQYLWITDALTNGNLEVAILCYIALGELYKASTTIAGAKKEDESWLSLAADLAKAAGQHTFADHLEDKKVQIKQTPNNQEIEDTLEQLPSRIELLLKNVKYNSSLKDDDDVTNDSEDSDETENEDEDSEAKE